MNTTFRAVLASFLLSALVGCSADIGSSEAAADAPAPTALEQTTTSDNPFLQLVDQPGVEEALAHKTERTAYLATKQGGVEQAGHDADEVFHSR